MEQDSTATGLQPDDRQVDRTGRDRRRPRRGRLVPPAVTPLTAGDIGTGLLGQARGRGRDRFRRSMESFLDGEYSATYTSFRRTLGACLSELRDTHEGDRDAVLIPSFCSSDFADAIEGAGLETVRYDVDPESLSLELSDLRQTLRQEPLAVVAVNVLGYSSPMSAVAEACAARDTYLVEALGYGIGATYDGDPLGTFGDCAVLNFQQGKPIPIGGGMVVSRNPDLEFGDEGRPSIDPNAGVLAGYAACSRPHAYYAYTRIADYLQSLGRSARITTHPESKLDVDYDRPFATISDFQGAVGCRVLRQLDDHRKKRQRTARFYADALSEGPHLEQLQPIGGLSNHQYVRYPLLIRPEALRDQLKTALIDAGVHATTLYDWPVIEPEQSPGGARLQQGILTLPTHPYVDDRDRALIVGTVRDTIGEWERSELGAENVVGSG